MLPYDGSVTGDDDRGGSGPWSALAIHATVYAAVNALLTAVWVLFGGGSAGQLGEVLTSLDAARAQGFWPMYVMVFWGAALLIHLGVVVATAPGRRRRRKERKRQARRRTELQASVVGALPDGVLTDAAVAGIRLTEGEKAARKVQRAAERQSSPPRGTAGGSKAGGKSGEKRASRTPRRETGGSSTGSGATSGHGKAERHRDRRHRDDTARRGGEGGSRGARQNGGTTDSDPATTGRPTGAAADAEASQHDPAAIGPEVCRDAGEAAAGEAAAAGHGAPGGGADRRPWVAVVFTDIVDSTTLNEALGDDAWASVLADHRALVRRALADHGGLEVGTQGDGFLLRFDDPDDAVRCAVAIQERLAEQRTVERRAAERRTGGDGTLVPAVRIGVHAGEAVHHDGDDLVGRVVNLAARVTDAADADEILVTEPVADHLGADVALVDRGLRQLKGFDRPRHLLAVVWQPAPDEIDLADGPSRRTDA